MFRVFQMEALDQLFGARAARALSQDGDLRVKIVAGLKVGFRVPLLIHPLVIGAHAVHAFSVEQQLTAGKAGKDGDPGLLHLGRQPLDELVDGDHVIAVVPQGRRHDGELVLALLGQKVDRLLIDFRVDGGLCLKAGQQFAHGAGVEQRSGKAVLSRFPGLLQNVNVLFGKGRGG